MTTKKFVEIPSAKKSNDKIDDWFDHCRRKQIPYITVKTRTKFANIHWDYISYDAEIDSILCKNENLIKDGVRQVVKKYLNENTSYSANCNLIYVDNIHLTDARMAAEEIYDLIATYATPLPSPQAVHATVPTADTHSETMHPAPF